MILRPKNQTSLDSSAEESNSLFFGRRIKRHTNASETTDKTVATDAKHPEPRNRGTKPGRRAPRKRSTKPHATKDASHSANRADESKLPGSNPCNGQPAGHPATTARDQPPSVAPAQKPQRAPYPRDLPFQRACKARKGGSTEHKHQTLQNSRCKPTAASRKNQCSHDWQPQESNRNRSAPARIQHGARTQMLVRRNFGLHNGPRRLHR